MLYYINKDNEFFFLKKILIVRNLIRKLIRPRISDRVSYQRGDDSVGVEMIMTFSASDRGGSQASLVEI